MGCGWSAVDGVLQLVVCVFPSRLINDINSSGLTIKYAVRYVHFHSVVIWFYYDRRDENAKGLLPSISLQSLDLDIPTHA